MENLKPLIKVKHRAKTSIFKRLIKFIIVILISVFLSWWASSALETPATYMLAILIAAALLWITETIPLFATSLLIIGAQIIFLGNPGNWEILRTAGTEPLPYRDFLDPISDPIIILFLGGFILAKVGIIVGVDRYISSAVLKIFGHSAKKALIGVIICTAIFGMWISNTATTAMMITLTGSFLASVPAGNPYRKAVTLAIPFSAGIGGLMTPISSPPNAIAVGLLANNGIHVGFLKWMIIIAPLALLLLFILYLTLWYFYKPDKQLSLTPVEVKPFTKKGKFVIVIFSITVLLWLTDTIHGIPSAVVALFPVIIFTATGLLNAKQFNHLDWNILFVIAGGLALGQGMSLTGLDQHIAEMIPVSAEGIIFIMFLLAIAMSTFISNTTAAVLLIPMAISMATISENIHIKFIVIGLAVMCGSSMILPISTPPNAIAYSTGELSKKDFAISGAIIGFCSLALTYGYFWLLTYLKAW
ncbi:MAG: DASS family sodium-coupled anion symporter [Ignavibacteria bacterium]|nr:DASS family sodium-coupled anion symporter [Ignavibacteria bacterium]